MIRDDNVGCIMLMNEYFNRGIESITRVIQRAFSYNYIHYLCLTSLLTGLSKEVFSLPACVSTCGGTSSKTLDLSVLDV